MVGRAVWSAGQCGRPGLVGGARRWRGGAVVSRCGRSAPHCGVGMGRHWGRKRIIGVGADQHWGGHGPALGQETVHWGRLITCPNGCFRAPMRIPRSDRSGVLDWAVAEDASARSRSPRRAWEGAAVEDEVTVGSVLTAIAPAGPPAVLRQGDCRVCSHSDTASVTRPSEGPVPIGARFHSDTDTAGSVFTAIPTRRAPFSQRCPWFHSGAPGFTAIPRRKCYSALGLLVSSATVQRRVGGPWVTEGGGGQRRRQPLSAGPRRLELVAPPGCGNRHRCPILSRACC